MGWVLAVIILLPFFATELFITILMAIFAVGFIVCLFIGSWANALGFLFVYVIVCFIADASKKGRIL